MKSRLIALFALIGLAALSPAPIKDMEGAKHVLPYQSQQQVEQEQQFNGQYGVVGKVPTKTDDNGTEVMPTEGDSHAASIVSSAGRSPNSLAIKNLAKAEKILEQQKQGGFPVWLIALIILGLGTCGFYALRIWLEKNGPAPSSLRT